MKKRKVIVFICVFIVVVAIISVYFYMKYRTYEYTQVKETYESSGTDNAQYVHCLEGILRYSRDGIALFATDGNEMWNQPCQMGNPIVESGGNSIAVCDKGGTSILVFQKKGLRGEIQTTRPIEKVAVSSQGVVSAILKDEKAPLVMCYDAKGNVLIEHKVSLKNMGYPIDVAISEDGNALLVSYLAVAGNSIFSKAVYYYFGEGGNAEQNYQVQQCEFENTVVPTVAFLNKEVSVLATDSALIFYKGIEQPKKTIEVEMKGEIQSLAYDDKIVAVIIKNAETSDCTLHIYNVKGELLSSVDVKNEYANIKTAMNQVILYDGQMCSIYMKNGIHKYEGNMDESIVEIFPIAGLNKYMVINASGFQTIQLAK